MLLTRFRHRALRTACGVFGAGIILATLLSAWHMFPRPPVDPSVKPILTTSATTSTNPSVPTITWSIDLSDWEIGPDFDRAIYTAELAKAIDQVLSSRQGWRQAGLIFRYTANAQGILVYHLRLAAQMHSGCGNRKGDNSGTCAGGLSWPGDPKHCDMALSDNHLFDAMAHHKPGIWLQIVNHETGHCLGFDHTDGGLMNAALFMEPEQTSFTMYPSAGQIANVHSRLVGLASAQLPP